MRDLAEMLLGNFKLIARLNDVNFSLASLSVDVD